MSSYSPPSPPGGAGAGASGFGLPTPARSKPERLGRAQTITVIVALIGMLGSTVTVVLGDYLQDHRRIDAERQLAYRDFLSAARGFQDDSGRKYAIVLQREIANIRDYQRHPSTSSSDQLSASFTDEQSAADAMWNSWATLSDKYEDVRLKGSPATIVSGGGVMDAATNRWTYLSDISNRLTGNVSKIRVTSELKRFEVTNFEDQPSSTGYWDSYRQCQQTFEAAP